MHKNQVLLGTFWGGEREGREGTWATCWIGAKSRPLWWVQQRALPSFFCLPLALHLLFLLLCMGFLFHQNWYLLSKYPHYLISENETGVISGAYSDTTSLSKLFSSVRNYRKGQQPVKKWPLSGGKVAFDGLCCFSQKGLAVKSRPSLADFWIIAFEHFHYVTTSCHLRKIFLISAKSRRPGPRISCNDTASFLRSLFLQHLRKS